MRLAPSISQTGNTAEEAFSYLSGRDREQTQISVSNLRLNPETGYLDTGMGEFEMTPHSATQLAKRLGITPTYLLKLPDALAAENMNTFLTNATGHLEMITEKGTTIAAFLREGTTSVDPIRAIERLSDEIDGHNLTLGRWSANDQGVFIKAFDPTLTAEPKLGDIVKAGVELLVRENTDISLSLRGLLYRLVCTNGATAAEDAGLRRTVRKGGWRDPEARLDMVFANVHDTLTEIFGLSANLKTLTALLLDIPEDDKDRIRYFKNAVKPLGIRGKLLVETVSEVMFVEDPTLFGLYNAVTRIGRDSTRDPKRATVFENAGQILASNPQGIFENISEFNIDEDEDEE